MLDPVLYGLPGSLAGSQGSRDPDKIRDAAAQFEALLIEQLLKSIREAASSGWMGAGEDQTSDTLTGLAEQQLALAMAAQGGLGLAQMIAEGVSRQAQGDGTPPPADMNQ